MGQLALLMDQKREFPDRPEQLIADELSSALKPFQNGQTILNEAEFGYRQIREHLEQCGPDARILEIGSGPCVLLSQLKIDFPHLDVTGIEPIGPGFDNFDSTLKQLMQKYCFKLQETGYEEFTDKGPFDLIFLINVFEHLPDWRDFLEFVSERLKSDGKCVILCPNYGFPYESHFSLPIILNKKLTYAVFKKSIKRQESENRTHGLWQSLNFVKWSDVKVQAEQCGLDIWFDTSILRRMIGRFQCDEAFAQRQKSVGWLARLALRSGAVRAFETPVLRMFNPYMHLVIRHRRSL